MSQQILSFYFNNWNKFDKELELYQTNGGNNFKFYLVCYQIVLYEVHHNSPQWFSLLLKCSLLKNLSTYKVSDYNTGRQWCFSLPLSSNLHFIYKFFLFFSLILKLQRILDGSYHLRSCIGMWIGLFLWHLSFGLECEWFISLSFLWGWTLLPRLILRLNDYRVCRVLIW